METNEKYSELEKRVIKQGFLDFRKELKKASIPMIEVLKKYGMEYRYGKVLQKIFLRYPSDSDFDISAVYIPANDLLKELEPQFLDMFLEEVKKLKETVDNLPIEKTIKD